MRVELLATTSLREDVMPDAYGYEHWVHKGPDGMYPTDADALAEAAGRICYKSFNRPNKATADNAGYLRNIIAQQHFSVLEHASASFLVRGVSRALLAELTRHRHLSFSVVSQRYVDYSGTSPVIPPAVETDPDLTATVCDAYAEAVELYDRLTAELIRKGKTRKQAREAARAVLPNAAPVDMVVTGNLRAWRDVLGKRHSPAADAEIQEFARLILDQLRDVAPNSVGDFL